MEKAKIRQKENIVKPQVIMGKEFKGNSFIAKPDKIIFKVCYHLRNAKLQNFIGFRCWSDACADYTDD